MIIRTDWSGMQREIGEINYVTEEYVGMCRIVYRRTTMQT
ncbi:hypothetical protein ACVLD2_001791 [Paenibacillus sp. PvR052]|nr:hypothetical protein [Paenibacillus sp. PvP091]MBP1170310.1 hypothetical protein [Paenibacillus sp. PvR098]MBP2441338.1 hypothetical protein [Paenibacillus sp. PvP052]